MRLCGAGGGGIGRWPARHVVRARVIGDSRRTVVFIVVTVAGVTTTVGITVVLMVAHGVVATTIITTITITCTRTCTCTRTIDSTRRCTSTTGTATGCLQGGPSFCWVRSY